MNCSMSYCSSGGQSNFVGGNSIAISQATFNNYFGRNLSVVSTDTTHDSDNLTTQKSTSSLGNPNKIVDYQLVAS